MRRLLVRVFLIGSLVGSFANAEPVEPNPLGFLLGHWQSEEFGQGATEFWTGDGSSMAGVFRGVLDNGRVITEFILIESNESGTIMRWNHFNEDFSRWEDAPIEHELLEIRPNYANFEMVQAEQGLPRNLVYAREGNTLTVWVGDLEAKDQRGAFEIKYQRHDP